MDLHAKTERNGILVGWQGFERISLSLDEDGIEERRHALRRQVERMRGEMETCCL